MSRPLNIVWMVTDHQAYANRPAFAQNFALQARLAREGMRFARAYTVLPICSPARASMLTGLYPHAHDLTENDGRFGGRTGLTPNDKLIHQPLSATGYRCAWFGKWHLDNHRSANDYDFEGFSLPGYGYPYATPQYLDYLHRNSLAAPVITIDMPGESGIAAGTRIDLTAVDDWFDFEAGAALLAGPAETHEAFFLADCAEQWLNTLVDDEPFFLRIDSWGPHPPYLLAAPYDRMFEANDIELATNFKSDLTSRPSHHQRYRDYWKTTLGLDEPGWRRMTARALAHVALVEAALARVLDTIDRLGLAEQTLVIFTADHGDAIGSNGGVANKGGLMIEETMKVPLLIRGPGIRRGSICQQLVANFDIAPTVLQWCGIDWDTEMHAKSLVELLYEAPTQWRNGLMAEHYGLHEALLQRAYYRDHWKLVVQQDGFSELYNLSADPYEMHNLATVPSYQETLAQMQTGLRETMSLTNDDAALLTNC